MLRSHFASLLLQLLMSLLLLLLAVDAGCPEDSITNDDGSCSCVPALLCPRHECPDGMQLVRVKDAVPESPGSCCPLYECRNQATLSYDPMEESHQCVDGQGQPRELGEHWQETDPCTNCSCEAPGPRPRCQTTMCRSCARPEPRLPNECCPRCASNNPAISCLDEYGHRRLEGERWSSGPCRSCICGPQARIGCNQTICSLGCTSPSPPPPGHCCPVCPPVQETEDGIRSGWGTIPIVLIVVLGLLCIILMVHLVRVRFRARLHPREIDFVGFSQQQQQQHQQQQYYKCVPVYEPVLRHAEKIAAL